jgi:hypothetical protein
MLTIAVFYIGFVIITGIAANTRGRSSFGFALLAILISPLLAIGILLALPKLEREEFHISRLSPEQVANRRRIVAVILTTGVAIIALYTVLFGWPLSYDPEAQRKANMTAAENYCGDKARGASRNRDTHIALYKACMSGRTAPPQ